MPAASTCQHCASSPRAALDGGLLGGHVLDMSEKSRKEKTKGCCAWCFRVSFIQKDGSKRRMSQLARSMCLSHWNRWSTLKPTTRHASQPASHSCCGTVPRNHEKQGHHSQDHLPRPTPSSSVQQGKQKHFHIPHYAPRCVWMALIHSSRVSRHHFLLQRNKIQNSDLCAMQAEL